MYIRQRRIVSARFWKLLRVEITQKYFNRNKRHFRCLQIFVFYPVQTHYVYIYIHTTNNKFSAYPPKYTAGERHNTSGTRSSDEAVLLLLSVNSNYTVAAATPVIHLRVTHSQQ